MRRVRRVGAQGASGSLRGDGHDPPRAEDDPPARRRPGHQGSGRRRRDAHAPHGRPPQGHEGHHDDRAGDPRDECVSGRREAARREAGSERRPAPEPLRCAALPASQFPHPAARDLPRLTASIHRTHSPIP